MSRSDRLLLLPLVVVLSLVVASAYGRSRMKKDAEKKLGTANNGCQVGPEGNPTKGRPLTLTNIQSGRRVRVVLRPVNGEPCTPSSLTLSLTNVGQLNIRPYFANGRFTNLVYNNTGATFSLPSSDLPEAVVRIVIIATPLTKGTVPFINSASLQGCDDATTTSATTGATATTPDVNPTAEEEPSSATTTNPMPECGVSAKLDLLNQANRGAVGGVRAGSCDVIPWQVRFNGRRDALCGGSILDANHILTAASCIPESDTFTVIAGDYSLSAAEPSEQKRTASLSNVTMHPDYVFSPYVRASDIAVIRLSEPLDLTQPCVKPVCLDPNLVINGQNCTVSGWSDSGYGTVDELQVANAVRTEPGENCVEAFSIPYNPYFDQPSLSLCAGYNVDADSCQGLTGGPLVCRDDSTNTYIQAGIASTSSGCDQAEFPVRYTRVNAFYDWIQAQIDN